MDSQTTGESNSAINSLHATQFNTHSMLPNQNNFNRHGDDNLMRNMLSEEIELKKLINLWKGAEREISSKNQEITNLRKMLDAKKQLIKSETRQTMDNLLEEIHTLRKSLALSKEENDRWAEGYDDAIDKIKTLQISKGEYEKEIEILKKTIQEEHIIIKDLEEEKNDLIMRCQKELRDQDENHLDSERIISKQEECLTRQQSEIMMLQKENSEMDRTINNLNTKIKEQDTSIIHLESTLTDIKNEITDYRVTRSSEEQFRQEVKQLKLDNQRLVSIIMNSTEFKDFSHDWIDGGSMSYVGFDKIPNNPKYDNYKTTLLMKEYYPPNSIPVDQDRELDLWLPKQILKLTNDFHTNIIPHVQLDVIEEYVRQLHFIWRERERNIITKVKERCNKQIEEIKRKNSNKVPYKEIILSDNIKSLKTELKKLQKLKYKPKYQITNSDIMKKTIQIIDELSTNLNNEINKNKMLNDELYNLKFNNSDYSSLFYSCYNELYHKITSYFNEYKFNIDQLVFQLQQNLMESQNTNYLKIINSFVNELNLKLIKIYKNIENLSPGEANGRTQNNQSSQTSKLNINNVTSNPINKRIHTKVTGNTTNTYINPDIHAFNDNDSQTNNDTYVHRNITHSNNLNINRNSLIPPNINTNLNSGTNLPTNSIDYHSNYAVDRSQSLHQKLESFSNGNNSYNNNDDNLSHHGISPIILP